jgi:CRP-like cAMP-binding protein
MERLAMINTHFAAGQVLFRERDPADSVFRLLRGAVDIFRELDGEAILLGTVGAGQFIGRWAWWKTVPAVRPLED